MEDKMSILDGYIKALKELFPSQECVIPTDEDGVYESSEWYECIIASAKFPEDGFHVQICRPYIWTNGQDIGYGWIHDKQNFYDNYQKPVRNSIDGYSVVAFRHIEDHTSYEIELEHLAQEICDNQVWDD